MNKIDTRSVATALSLAAGILKDFCYRNHGIEVICDSVLFPPDTPKSVKKIWELAIDLQDNAHWQSLPDPEEISIYHPALVASEFVCFEASDLAKLAESAEEKVKKQILYLENNLRMFLGD